MPSKKITFKKGKNETVYVYHILKSFRNENGNPTSKEVLIGKKDLETGELIPNDRYFEIYPKENRYELPNEILSYGNFFAFFKLAEELGLTKTLMNHFSNDWEKILTTSIYIICEGNVMLYLEDWLENTYLPEEFKFSAKHSSEFFASISHDKKINFFRDWTNLRKEQEYIAYDITSISTYAKEIDLAEWGYNRDNDSLPQVNLGMFFGQTSHIPIFYNVYNGSVPDKSHLIFMMEHTQIFGIEKIKFVMDRGFLTQPNLKYMRDEGHHFIVPFPDSRAETPTLIEEVLPTIKTARNWIDSLQMYGTSVSHKLYDIDVKVHIYYDLDKRAHTEKKLYSHINSLEKKLEALGKPKRIPKQYKAFFDVEKEEEENKIEYEKNYDKIDGILQYAGFIVFVTSDISLTSEELLHIYKGRDGIEKHFDELKNELDFSRLHTHIDKTMEGKMFVAFIALILRSYLEMKIFANEETKKWTIKKVLLELEKIKLLTFSGTSKMFMPLTRKQKQILEALGITLELL
jgi:transposase